MKIRIIDVGVATRRVALPSIDEDSWLPTGPSSQLVCSNRGTDNQSYK